MIQHVNSISLDFGAASHKGGRRINQDTWCTVPINVGDDESSRLFAVADGMGGHKGGGVASRMACRGLVAFSKRSPKAKRPCRASMLQRILEETVLLIDRNIRRVGIRHPKLDEMGTTLSCLLAVSGHTIIAHVGDSRIYRLRRGYLTCLTSDHTFVQDMIFEGEIDMEQASVHPMRHILTRVVGTTEPLERVDTRIDALLPGDRFLLCTDGLHNTLAPEQIAQYLGMPRTAEQIGAIMVAAAIKAGAGDNVTAIVINHDTDD